MCSPEDPLTGFSKRPAPGAYPNGERRWAPLVSIVGNSGVGKTALCRALLGLGGFSGGLEEHAGRPFQAAFARGDRRLAIANQIDYLLLRAEQEQALRLGPLPGLQDGGLDEDFFVFTRHFFQKGHLSAAEYALCQRLHAALRRSLPPPDLFVRLAAPLEVVARRYARRGRPLEVAGRDDLAALEALLDDWLGANPGAPVLLVDASDDDPGCARLAPLVRGQITARLGLSTQQGEKEEQ